MSKTIRHEASKVASANASKQALKIHVAAVLSRLNAIFTPMLRIGVLGAGHLGKIHLNCLNDLKEAYEVTGFYDPNEEIAQQLASERNLKAYSSIDELIKDVDVVDIVTPTLSHFECARKALLAGKHVFIEKPVTHTLEEADSLMKIHEVAGTRVQVGHVERFNPAFRVAHEALNKPMFIEAHRLAQFNPRGTDVPVVLDLMIHDIDIVLSTVRSPLKKLSASGVSVVSDTPDIANARLEFENGCVANLTASRISLKNMRKARFFQRDAYITVDFLEKKTELVRMQDDLGEDPYAMVLDLGDGRKKQILFEQPEVSNTNAIRDELKSLSEAINKQHDPIVPLSDGVEALRVAIKILEEMDNQAAAAI
jgi:predicted dehydrogenase